MMSVSDFSFHSVKSGFFFPFSLSYLQMSFFFLKKKLCYDLQHPFKSDFPITFW